MRTAFESVNLVSACDAIVVVHTPLKKEEKERDNDYQLIKALYLCDARVHARVNACPWQGTA